MGKDIRWLQRFSNYKKAFGKLKDAGDADSLSELEQEGLIQRFEYTFELAWNTIKDFLEYQGYQGITGSRDAFKIASERGLIKHGELWFQMLESRKKTTHTYDQETADEISEIITETYIDLFRELIERLEKETEVS
jgi:nucleotidyltransferase substrate binding protein (TIGR01987 family)